MSDNNIDSKLTAAELLASYQAANEEVNRCQELLEEANRKRSDVVKNMYQQLGKGPFEYRGVNLGKIVIRGNTYFLRSNRDNTIKIE